jgi:hypothetical protein
MTRRDRALRLAAVTGNMVSAEESALIGEVNREVMAALRALPARQREAVVLRYYLARVLTRSSRRAWAAGHGKVTTIIWPGAAGLLLANQTAF